MQLLLGASQGPIFPVSTGVFETWFTPARWPLVQGLQTMGLQIGAALTPPLIAWLMYAFDWQRALAWTLAAGAAAGRRVGLVRAKHAALSTRR